MGLFEIFQCCVSFIRKQFFRERYLDFKHVLVIVALCLIYVLGVVVRIHDLPAWLETPERAFLAGEPLLKTSDGYFYLALSRDILRNDYTKIDSKRAVPDSPSRPFPPPLLSVITAYFSKITGLSLNWTALILPVLVGPLMIFPLYGIGVKAGGKVCGLAGALFGVTSDYFVYRSSAGWFDTDILILFLLLMVIWLFMLFGACKTPKRYLYLLGGLLFSCIFFWWWDQAPYVVAALCFWPLFLSLVFFYRPKRIEFYVFAAVIVSVFFVFIFSSYREIPFHAFEALLRKFKYISKADSGLFPNIGVSIAEQQVISPLEAAKYTVGGIEQLVLAGVGLSVMFLRNYRYTFYLAPPLVIGMLSIFFAQRFLIFLTPVAVLGIAFFVKELWYSKKTIYRWFAYALMIMILSGQLLQNTSEVTWPFLRPASARGMSEIALVSPMNSVVWSWWDQGYALTYWADRGTINDGSVHSGERTVYNAIPFATANPRLSANFISFFTVHGMKGVRKMIKKLGGGQEGLSALMSVLGTGPSGVSGLNCQDDGNSDELLRYLFPKDLPPVYLFIDKRMMQVSSWWFWFGTWNPAKRDGIRCFSSFFDKLLVSPERIVSMWGFNADLEKGLLNGLPAQYRLKEVRLHFPESLQVQRYNESGLVLQVNAPRKFALLQSSLLAESLLTRLFVISSSEEYEKFLKYFEPVANDSPEYQIWKVRSDGMLWQ